MQQRQPAKRRSKQPWVVVDDEDTESGTDPGTPRQLRMESRAKNVTLLDYSGKEVKAAEVTDQMGNKSFFALDNPEMHKPVKRPGANARTQTRWQRMTRDMI